MQSNYFRYYISLIETLSANISRIHNSNKPIQNFINSPSQTISRKPLGLWWSIGNTWENFISNAPKNSAAAKKKIGQYNYVIEITPDTNIIFLYNWDDILNFTIEYGSPMPHSSNGFFWQSGDKLKYDPLQDDQLKKGRCKVPMIDWKKVSYDYDGIEIIIDHTNRPYVDWLDIDWDITSGCVWNLDNIKIYGPVNNS